MRRVPVGVLASGTGSNLGALLSAAATAEFPAEIVVVGSDRPMAPALDRARAAGVPTFAHRARDFSDRPSFDAAMAAGLKQHGAEWVVLAGYMRLVSSAFLGAFPDRVVNVHPALLPSFPGTHAQRQAFDAGVKVSGVTVHLVDEGMDTGPILAQAAVPVLDDDDADRLAARILKAEHQLLPVTLARAVTEPWRRDGRRILWG